MSKNTNLSFLTDYITADITNGRIGINNASPTVAFDVTGVAKFSSSVTATSLGIGLTAAAKIQAEVGNTTSVGLFSASGLAITSSGGSTGNVYQIAFGYGSGGATYGSSALYGTTESSAGYNTGALVFATRSATTDTAPTEKMRITSAGNVGIGVTSVGYPLQVNKTGTDSGIYGYNVAQFGDNTTNAQGLRIATSTGTSGLTNLIAATNNDPSQFAFWTWTGSAWGERMRIFANGNISIQDTFVDNGSKLNITSGAKGAMRILANATYDAISVGGTGAIRADYPGVGGGRFELNDAGTLYLRQYSNGTLSISSGQVVSSSDKNLKIEDGYINNALDKISKLTPTYFYWKEDSGIETNERQLGFFAQNVQEALGEEVANNNGNDKWGIYDRGIIAMLTKGIQELKAEIETLKNK